MVDGGELYCIRMLAEGHVFGVFLVTQDAVVQNHDSDRQVQSAERLELRPAMAEAAVPTQADDAAARGCDLRADRHRQAPAQAGDPTRGQKALASPTRGQTPDDPDRGV